jgi:hypothetical protein
MNTSASLVYTAVTATARGSMPPSNGCGIRTGRTGLTPSPRRSRHSTRASARGQFELLREWVIVFDERSRHLYTDQDRANVLMAVAKAAQRVADQDQDTVAT